MRAHVARAEPVLVEERTHAVEHEQRRLRRALGVGRGLDDVARRHRAILCGACAAASTSCATPRSRTSATTGRPVNPAEVPLNEEGVAQAKAVAEALGGDRARPRRHERPPAHARDGRHRRARRASPSPGPSSARSRAAGSRRSRRTRSQHEFVHAFRGVIPNEARFLRGESIGELFDRVAPRRRAARRRGRLAHGARRPPRRREPRDPLLRAHGRADVPRPLRAGARVRQRPRPRRGRRVDRARRQRRARTTSSTSRTARRRWSATGSNTGTRTN